MNTIVAERNKLPGLCYAVSDEGLELPVIDLTHPAFTEHHTPEELDALAEATMRNLEATRWIPHFVHRMLARKSRLLRGTLDAMGGILGGMPTYLLKLGPDNLGRGYAVALDRKIASALAPVAMRLRLRAVASFLASGIADRLRVAPRRPVHLLNIGGGTATDSINALLLLVRDEPSLLDDTSVRLDILDIDESGPRFGLRALEVLHDGGGSLHDLDLRARHVRYDWHDSAALRTLLDEAATGSPLLAVSSEGGLFEYGSDMDIDENLGVLRAQGPADAFIVATTIRDVPIARLNKERSHMPIRITRPEELVQIAQRAGWIVESAAGGNPMYEVSVLSISERSEEEQQRL